MRQLTHLDHLITHLDVALKSLAVPEKRPCQRPNPANRLPEPLLSDAEKRHVIGLMRVNHTGEICAQALYQGQAITAKRQQVKTQMQHAAEEEIDHLAWCEERLHELGGQPSHLNVFWYTSALLLGVLAGAAGDSWSLGFVAETERQVTAHLLRHQQQLPEHDTKTWCILNQMQQDETHHAHLAMASGGRTLPLMLQQAMRHVSKIMTYTSYYF